MKIWHNHSTAEGHSTLLASVAFTYIININRTPSSSSDSSDSEQAKKYIIKNFFRFMIPRADGHEKERSAPENIAWRNRYVRGWYAFPCHHWTLGR